MVTLPTFKLLYPGTNVIKDALVATSKKYKVALETAPQLALREVQVKLSADVAVGEIGGVVPILIVFEFKLVLQPLSARTR